MLVWTYLGAGCVLSESEEKVFVLFLLVLLLLSLFLCNNSLTTNIRILMITTVNYFNLRAEDMEQLVTWKSEFNYKYTVILHYATCKRKMFH